MSDENSLAWITKAARTERGRAVMAGLLGLLVGDAAGVHFECTPPDKMPNLWAEGLFGDPPEGAHPVPVGTYSDDGCQALATFDSLTIVGRPMVDDVGARLLRWFDTGYLSPGGKAFGAGGTTKRALEKIRQGTPATHSGLADDGAMGNAPLMRGAALALWHHMQKRDDGDEELALEAFDVTHITHAHARPTVVAAVFCILIRMMLEDPQRVVAAAARAATARFLHLFQRERGELPSRMFAEGVALYQALETVRPTGEGNIVQTFISAVAANRRYTFQDVVTEAIMFGHDTDSTAAAAAVLAAIRFGLSGIPLHHLAKVASRIPDDARTVLERVA